MKTTKSEIIATMNSNLRAHSTSSNFIFLEDAITEIKKTFTSLGIHTMAANQIICRLELSEAGKLLGTNLDVILQTIEEAMSDMTC